MTNMKTSSAHIEAAAECISSKTKAKCRVSWGKKRLHENRTLLNKINPTNANVQKHRKALRELTHTTKKKKKRIHSRSN